MSNMAAQHDLALSPKALLRVFDVRAGLHNAFNRKYADPIALAPGADTRRHPGYSSERVRDAG